jgi:hypothetical protein
MVEELKKVSAFNGNDNSPKNRQITAILAGMAGGV